MLEVDRITVRAGRRRPPIVRDISFSARPGEILAVLGPNGAGKTTLLEAVVGVRQAEGAVRWRGRLLEGFEARAATFAFMPDEAALPEEVSVRLVLGGSRGEALGLRPLWDRSAGSLSRGEAKRVWLAWALALERPVIVLDEPFGAFDPLQIDGVLEVVRDRARAGAAVIASIHQMTTAERVADRVALVAGGTLVAEGTVSELRERARRSEGASLEEVFRALVEVADAPPA